MDSDTHLALQDNKSYIRAENLRISGKGNDGVFQSIKGSELVSDAYSEKGMVVLGAYEGANNKNYFLLAMPNQLSKIIEYDTQTKETKLILEDTETLRFDLVRWNKGEVIKPYQYILNINQIGDLLFISGEWWEYPRVIKLNGATTNPDSIILAKKPPRNAPEIIPSVDFTNKNNNDKNIFISFSYRYKYVDGDYSALSFYSDVAFLPKLHEFFSVNEQRDNEAMINTYDKVRIAINSGSELVTDIEVYAREHGSNTAYLIYSVNKEQTNIQHNTIIQDIEYQFSKNYEVLNEEATNMLFSNVPKFPKTQTVAGNRIIYGNYKEGYDLEQPINFKVDSNHLPLRKRLVPPAGHNPITIVENPYSNKTVISLFKYKVGVIFYNDYNESTTILLPTNQTKAEVEIGFENRINANSLSVTMFTPPPTFATKMKFAVMSEVLNFENIFTSIIRKVGEKLYLKIDGNNVNKIKKGDTITPISIDYQYQELEVENILMMDKSEGIVPKSGLYAIINIDKNFYVRENEGEDMSAKNERKLQMIDTEKRFLNAPNRFIGGQQYIRFNHQGFSKISEGDIVKISFSFHYLQKDSSDVNNQGSVNFKFPSTLNFDYEFFASRDYENIGELLTIEFTDHKFHIVSSNNYTDIITNSYFAEYIKQNYDSLYHWRPYKKFEGISTRSWNLVANIKYDVTIDRGIKPIIFRTKNKENIQSLYYETPKTFSVKNGQFIDFDSKDSNGNPIFDIGFYNGYCWGNGVESYKIKDRFNAKELKHQFRGNAYDKKGYKRVHRKYDLTYSGIYNHEMGINELSTFNPSLANWKTLPIHYGEIQRIISTDGDITVFCTDKIIQQFYGKSILMDMTGNENVGLTKEVLGDYRVLPYEFGISNNPESLAKYSDILFFTDKKRGRFLMKQGQNIEELNAFGGGFYNEGIQLLNTHQNFVGSFDETNNEYVISLDGEKCIGFNVNNKGFTSYYTYQSDFLLGGYGKHYTCHNGKIYLNEATENYNDFAGQGTQTARLKFAVNTEFATDKVFKAIMLQSNTAWNVDMSTNLTKTQFTESAFTQKESFFYSEIYRDIATPQNLKGVGIISSVDGGKITFQNEIPSNINVGDTLLTEEMETIGEVTTINQHLFEINYQSTTNQQTPSINQFIVAQPPMQNRYRPDGAPMRGKWMEVTLSKKDHQLFYISSAHAEVISSKL